VFAIWREAREQQSQPLSPPTDLLNLNPSFLPTKAP